MAIEKKEITPFRKWMGLVAVSLGVFMSLLDTTVVNVALPSIQKSLNANYSDLQWVISAYTITFAVLLLIAAKLGDLYGRKLIFIISLIIFTLGSGLDAMSSTIGMLHIFRVVQAIGGSGMMALSFAIIASTFNGKERGLALGILSSIIGLATASGPLLGGWLVDAFNWQSIFTINIPVGIITIILGIIFIDNFQEHRATGGIDIVGMLLSAGTIFTLVFGLTQKEMNSNWGWTNINVAGYLVAAIVFLGLFIWREKTTKNPMMELSIFKSKSFTGAVIVSFFLGAGLYAFFAYLIAFMQDYVGYSAWQTGLRQLAISGFSLILGPVAGILSNRLKHGYMIAASSSIIALGLLTMSFLVTKSATFNEVWPAYIIIGIGSGTINPPLTSAPMASVQPRQIGMASGMISTFMQVGTSFGVVLQGLILSSGYNSSIKEHIAKFENAPKNVIASLQKTLIDAGPFAGNSIANSKQLKATPFSDLVAKLVRNAYDQGFINELRVDAAFMLVAAIIAFVFIRQNKKES
jgi:EmrB/QacA subfamily drug resistance transporter